MEYNIEEIIKIFEASNVARMEVEIGEMKLKLFKNGATEEVINSTAQTITNLHDIVEISGYKVLAPVVGTYYAQKAANKPAFVKKGDKVKKGDVLCIIEAMKVMNEVTAPVDGTIIEVSTTNESLVEYDQLLFVIEE